MHIKHRGPLACLYRSTWIRKGQAANTHGYARQTYVTSLRRDAEHLPAEVVKLLTTDECQYVEERVCQPARAAAEAVRASAREHDEDPNWRLEQARRLLEEAADRSQHRTASETLVIAVASSMARLRTEQRGATRPDTVRRSDPVHSVVQAARAAAQMVREGAIGRAPETGARGTETYRHWMALVAEIQGTAPNSLLAALQDRQFVKRNRKS